MKVLFYRNDWGANATRQVEDGYGGVGYYRIINPAKHFKGHEVDVVGIGLGRKGETMEQKWTRIFKEYDVFWTTYFYSPEEASCMFYHRDKFKKKVVIDLDDDYLAILPTHPLYDVMKPTKKNRAITSTILSFADVITVSTDPLKQKMAAHMKQTHGLDKKIVVVPNMNDKEDWQFKPAPKRKGKVVIGYAGSNSHYDDLEMVLPAINRVMEKYPNVYFESIGAMNSTDAKRLFRDFSVSAMTRCDLLPSTWTFKEYPKHLSKQKWDIAIAPLVDSAFTRSKSHIKFMEYSMYKIPIVASRVYPYYVPAFGRDVITHEETGLLVDPKEWEDALEDLIVHPDKRKTLGENAYRHVTENWQYDEEFSERLVAVVADAVRADIV